MKTFVCIKYGVPLFVHTEWNAEYYPQYSHPFFIKQLAENNPDLNIICCHIWNPRVMESFKLTQELSYGSLSIEEHLELVLDGKLKENEINKILKETYL